MVQHSLDFFLFKGKQFGWPLVGSGFTALCDSTLVYIVLSSRESKEKKYYESDNTSKPATTTSSEGFALLLYK